MTREQPSPEHEPTTWLESGTPVWVTGKGPTVVLIHGVLMDHRMWDALTLRLTPEYRVVRFDMLGHGCAPNPAGRRKLNDFVEQTREVVDAFSEDGPPVLVGFSMGGLIGQAYAVGLGDSLRGLVLMNAVYDRDELQRTAVRRRLDAMLDGAVDETIKLAAERWFSEHEYQESKSDIKKIFSWIRDGEFASKVKAYAVFAYEDEELVGQLHQIRVPTLVVTGERDVGSTPSMSEAMAAAIPGARLVIRKDQRHMMPSLDAEGLSKELQDFLQAL